jgi:ribonuclease PH
MNIVKTGDGRFIEVQGTAEGPPCERRALDDRVDLADAGIRELVTLQRTIVGDIRG